MADSSSSTILSSAMLETSVCTWTIPHNSTSVSVQLNLLAETQKHVVSVTIQNT